MHGNVSEWQRDPCAGWQQMKYVLLDEEGQPVRYFDYPADGTVELVEPKRTYDELLDQVGDCLL